jgi:dienelactone hydrolase
MRGLIGTLLATGLFFGGRGLAGQDATFVLRTGSDTVSIERFSRGPDRLTAELLLKTASIRLKFSAEVKADGTVPRFTNAVWLGADSAQAPARQSAVFDFVGDSVIITITGAGQQTQRLATKAGALPYVNPSFALMELAIARARAIGSAGGGEVPMFLVGGGQTLPLTVKQIGTDSASVMMAGGETRVRIDEQGRILGGSIVAQNTTIERVAGDRVSLAVEKPDYSAPKDAPYEAIDVTVSTSMGHTLAGTLTIPRGASARTPVPAVVTITGSGSQDRDEAIPTFKGFRPFREIADTLGRRGIAVLRMDDRGFGGSGGDAQASTSADFAKDIQAGLAYLRTRPEIDGRRLGLIGHSEGGLIAPMVAAADPSLAGIVLLAGTAYTGRQILTFQMVNAISNDTSLSQKTRDSLRAKIPTHIDSLETASPWMKFFSRYDPITTARSVRTPVLILNGATDQQVTPDQVPLLEQAFKAAGNRDVTAKVLPNQNHLFVHDPDGYPGRYTRLKSFAVDQGTKGLVVEWLARRLLKPAA